jgi:hypothetical protein
VAHWLRAYVAIYFRQGSLVVALKFFMGEGLPDGIFSYQKSQFGYLLEGLGIEAISRPSGIFSIRLVYFVIIWYILWSFGIICGHLVYFTYSHLIYFIAVWSFVVIWYVLWPFVT